MLMPSPHRERHDEYIARYLRTGEARVIGIGRELEGLRRDGTTFPMELALSEVAAASDQRRFTGIIRDITARKAGRGGTAGEPGAHPGHPGHGRRRHHHHRRPWHRRKRQSGRRAVVRLCPGRTDRPQRLGAHAVAAPRAPRRVHRPLPADRRGAGHRHRPRARRPAARRHDLPDGAGAQRGARRRPATLYRHHSRHHRAQAGRAGIAPGGRAQGRVPGKHVARAAHAAERHHRHRPVDARRRDRIADRRAASQSRDGRGERPPARQSRQRPARLLQAAPRERSSCAAARPTCMHSSTWC